MTHTLPTRILTKHERSQAFWTLLVTSGWKYLGLSVILGAMITSNGSPNLGMPLMFILPLVLANFRSKKKIRQAEDRVRIMGEKLNQALPHIDFYRVEGTGGIALDAQNQRFAIVSTTVKMEPTEALAFDIRIIRSYEAYSPEYTSTKVYGNLAAGLQADMDTLRNKRIAFMETGLYLHTSDIEYPKIHVQMKYDAAEAWLLLIEKCLANELPSRPAPSVYPFPKDE